MSEEEVVKLNTAITAKKKDDLIDFILSKKRSERTELINAYKTKYGKELRKVLEKELSGDFKDLCCVIFMDPIDYDCESLYLAMKGAGTNEDTLIDVIASRNNETIQKITTRYKEIYGKELAKEIESETSGTFGKMLIALLKGERVKNDTPDKQATDDYAQKLTDLFTKKTKDEAILDEIFLKRSPKELAYISRAYHRLNGKTILEGINNYGNKDLRNLLTTIIYCKISPSEYEATQINKSIKGAGTNESLLDRIIITRSEVDMPKIIKYYKKLYNVDMSEDIIGDTSGDYQTLLLKLCEL